MVTSCCSKGNSYTFSAGRVISASFCTTPFIHNMRAIYYRYAQHIQYYIAKRFCTHSPKVLCYLMQIILYMTCFDKNVKTLTFFS